MKRTDFTSAAIREALGKQPRTHRNCIGATEKLFGKGRGVARPGKTACERARRERVKK